MCDRNEEQHIGCLLAIAASYYQLAAEEEEKKTRQNKKLWVKEWRLIRQKESSFKFIKEELRLQDKDAYRRYVRMDESCFIRVLNYVKSSITKEDTEMRVAIPADEKLAAVLRSLATGESFRSLEYQTRLSLAFLSESIPEICKVLYNNMKYEHLKFPQTIHEWKQIAEKFHQRWQFPLCIGALDGKHIAFRASKRDGALYQNYKSFDSIVLLALVDSDYKFVFVDIGRNGRVSDGGVFQRSDLRQIVSQSHIYLPPDEFIGNQRKLPYSIITDNAFALEKHILKPYPYNSSEKEKQIFNFRLSHARQTVEHSFGILANRYRILQTKIHLKPEKVVSIVQATCVLLNFLIKNNPQYAEPITRRSMKPTAENNPQSSSRHPPKLASDMRKQFAEYFSEEGALPWQDAYI